MRQDRRLVVFLDFDGVTHPHLNASRKVFREAQLESLGRAICGTWHKARIVVISSWRTTLTIEDIQNFLGNLGYIVIDKAGDAPSSTKAPRKDLVEDWLGRNKYDGIWVAIDDRPDQYGELANRVYTPASLEGFLEEDILPFRDFVVRTADTHTNDRVMASIAIHSGGQTGADRAALDFAIDHGIEHGGWCPPGRVAEDGAIDQKYNLREVPEGSYRQRTKRNVVDTDATLIVNAGKLEGGTLSTFRFTENFDKPALVVQLDGGITSDVTVRVRQFLAAVQPRTLNIAGPRESKRRGIYQLTYDLLRSIYGVPK